VNLRQTPMAGRRSREVPAMVEAQVAGFMKMLVGFVNICSFKRKVE
jgi:hypothetical protein